MACSREARRWTFSARRLRLRRTTIEETGLGADQIAQLMAKHLYAGELAGLTLADRLRLPYALIEPLIEQPRPSG